MLQHDYIDLVGKKYQLPGKALKRKRGTGGQVSARNVRRFLMRNRKVLFIARKIAISIPGPVSVKSPSG